MPWPKPMEWEYFISPEIFFFCWYFSSSSTVVSKILWRIQGFWPPSPPRSLGAFKNQALTSGEKTDHKEHKKLKTKKNLTVTYFNLFLIDCSVSKYGGKNLDIHLQELSEGLEQPLPGSSGGKKPASLLRCFMFRWNRKLSDLVSVIHSDISSPVWVSVPRALITRAGLTVKLLLPNIQKGFVVQC